MSSASFPDAPGCSLPESLRSEGRCLVMGVLNVTPNSFSDGGLWSRPSSAIAHAEDMVEAGADLIDVGGQSTRPGAEDVAPDDEWQRIDEVVNVLVRAGITVSVDTIHAAVAARAADAGAAVINDVSGGLADPAMGAAVAASGAAYVCQHWRGNPQTMDQLTDYGGDVVGGVLSELAARLRTLAEAGVDLGRVIIDPGLGFAKTADQSWQLLAATSRLVDTGFPVLVGASRKRFLALAAPADADAVGRDAATAAVSAVAAAAGAWAVRVHDVASSVAAVRTVNLVKEHS